MNKKPEKTTEAETDLDLVIRDLEEEVETESRPQDGRFSCLRWIYCI